MTYRQAEFDGVDRLVEGPGELMLPQSLHHHVLHVLQLVGLSDGHREHSVRLTGAHAAPLAIQAEPVMTSQAGGFPVEAGSEQ